MIDAPFFPIRKEDLDDPELFRLNRLLSHLIEELSNIQGASGISEVGAEFRANRIIYRKDQGQPQDDNEVLTWGAAKRYLSPNAVSEALRRRSWMGQPVRPMPRPSVEGLEEPGPVEPIDGDAFRIDSVEEDGENVRIRLSYDPPRPIGSFVGVAAYVEAPEGSGDFYFTGNHDYDGDANGTGEDRYGHALLILPQPYWEDQQWRIYLCSRSEALTAALDPDLTPNMSILVHRRLADVRPIGGDAFLIDSIAEDGTNVTISIRYDPPLPIGSFVGVAAYVEAPSGSGDVFFTGNHDYDGNPNASGPERYGKAVLILPQPPFEDQTWTIYLCSRSLVATAPLNRDLTPHRDVLVHMRSAITEPEPPDVAAYGEHVKDKDGRFGFSGVLVFPTNSPNYSVLDGIEIDFWGPLDSNGNETADTGHHIKGIEPAPAPGQGNVEVEWTSDFWPRPEQVDCYRVRYTKITRTGARHRNTPFESSLLSVLPIDQAFPCPDVPLFMAGKMQQDGSFQSTMYWDNVRPGRLCVDWIAFAPSVKINWSGIAVYIETPNGDQHDATGFIPKEDFVEDENGTLYARATIFIEPENVPASPQNWKFICASYDRKGRLKRDQNGKITGPYVYLQTLVHQVAQQVSNFSVQKGRGANTPQGEETWYLTGSYTAPDDPLWLSVRIVGIWSDDPNNAVVFGDFFPDPGATTGYFSTDSWPVPKNDRQLTVYAFSVSHTGTVNKIGAPYATLTIGPSVGVKGREYAPVVLNPSAQRLSSYGDTRNFDPPGGGEMFGFQLAWTDPQDPDYTGCKVYARSPAGALHELTGVHRASETPIRTSMWPLGDGDVGTWRLFFVSVRGSLENTINENPNQGQVTPYVDVLVSRQSYSGVKGERVTNIPIASFASTIRPVGLGSVLPSLPNTDYPEGSYFYNVNNDTLYRSTGTSWVQAVSSNDIQANAVIAGKIAAGAVGTTELTTGEIKVGGGGGKPGMFGVYNASNSLIGFIGVYSGYQGAWFKELRIGGSGISDAPVYADSSGNVTIDFATGGSQIKISQNDPRGPFMVKNTLNNNRVRVMSQSYATGVFVSSNDDFLIPHASVYIDAYTSTYISLSSYTGSVISFTSYDTGQIYASIGNSTYDRRWEVDVDLGSTSRMRLSNMDIVVDGSYTGQTVDISYAKPGGGSGTLSFRRGILVSYS